MAPKTEDLEAKLKLLQKISAEQKKFTKMNTEQQQEFRSAMSAMLQSLAAVKQSRTEARLAKAADTEAEKSTHLASLNRLQEQADFARERQGEITTALRANSDLQTEMDKKRAKEQKTLWKDLDEAYKEGVKTRSRTDMAARGNAVANSRMLATSIEQIGGGANAVFEQMHSLIALRLMKALFGVGDTFDSYRTSVQGLGSDYETASTSFAKNLGMSNPLLKRMLANITDIRGAVALSGRDYERFGGAVKDTGITTTMTATQMEKLIEKSAEYRRLIQSGELSDIKAAEAATHFQVALTQLGAGGEKLADVFDHLTRVKGEDTETAINTILTYANVGDQLGVSTKSMYEDFGTLSEQISAWGTDSSDVFLDMQTLAAKTGISVGDLGQAAMKLDTFKGATQMAQTFNAVLADTGVRLSPEKLFQMEPAEKMRYLGEKMKEAGIDFENAGGSMRHLVRAFAKTAGMKVPDLKKLLLSPDALAATAKGLDKTALAPEALAKKIRAGMTEAELMKAKLPDLVTGIAELVENSRPHAEAFSELTGEMFGGYVAKLGSASEATLAFRTTLEVISRAMDITAAAKQFMPGMSPGAVAGAGILKTGLLAAGAATVAPKVVESLVARPRGPGGQTLLPTETRTEETLRESPINIESLQKSLDNLTAQLKKDKPPRFIIQPAVVKMDRKEVLKILFPRGGMPSEDGGP